MLQNIVLMNTKLRLKLAADVDHIFSRNTETREKIDGIVMLSFV